MSFGEIAYMDVVANAGAIGSGVIMAEDLDVLAQAEGDIEHQGNDMRLGLVRFAARPVGVDHRAGDVEVTETGVAQAVDLIDPSEHMFDEKLRLAISIGGLEPGVFADGHAFGVAVNGGGRGEDQPVDLFRDHGFEQAEGGRGVAAEIDLGMFHAFAGFDQGGEVHDSVEGTGSEDAFELGAVGNVALNEFGARRKQVAPGVTEVVVDDHFVTFVQQRVCDRPADVACASSDQDSQYFLLCDGYSRKLAPGSAAREKAHALARRTYNFSKLKSTLALAYWR